MLRIVGINRNVKTTKLLKRYLSAPIYLSHDIYEGESSKLNRENGKSIIFTHGILGNKRNWRTASHEFLKLRNNFKAIAVDHPGHGVSPADLSTHTSVESCAIDLLNLLNNKLEISLSSSILCGHSFGGKVVLKVLKLLEEQQKEPPRHVWILDSLPGKFNRELDANGLQSVYKILKVVESLPNEMPSREWVSKTLLENGISRAIVAWIMTNLVSTKNSNNKDEVKFTFDINVILQLFDDFMDTDMWDFLENYNGNADIHFLRAGKNAAWDHETMTRFDDIMESNYNIHLYCMSHVGHWLHSEDLHGMLKIINDNSPID